RLDSKPVFWFCVAAAWLPDIDNLAGFLGPEQYLLYHRGITHSVFGGLALALAFAGVFRLFSKKVSFVTGFLVAYSLILIHIFLDLVTSYGTQVLSPLTTRRYAISSVFIVDPLFTLTMIFFLSSTRLWKKHANKLAMAGLAWVLLYPMLCLFVKEALTSHYDRRLRMDEPVVPYQRIELSTEPFSPFVWKLLAEDGARYHLVGLTLFDPQRELSFETYSKPPPELVKPLEQRISMLKTYLWFAKYPVMTSENRDGKRRLLFNDLRFASTVGFLKRSMRADGAPFSLVVELDAVGNPLDWQYREPGGNVVVHYLE
ncbi:MAG: metal-dependent hydrolase, partial [Candidatus Lindowbacteria bacterium]|nr:metal-dependent hydrolase [Candidatus Lindowbacteria bacterium]